MPLIKDKYGAKGTKARSKYLTRKDNRAIVAESYITKTETSASAQVTEEQAATKDQALLKISGIKLPTINKVTLVATIQSGETLLDIIISHYNASGNSTVSLYWSASPPEDLTFTAASGLITAVTGGTAYRLLSESFPAHSTLSLAKY